VEAGNAIRIVDQFGNTVEMASRKTGALTNATRSLVAGLGALVGGGAVLRKVIDESTQAQAAQAQLAAVLRSTGGVAGQTAESINAHAAALQRVSAYGDDAIVSAQALLLTFTKIGGEAFPQATEAVLNVATAMGMDLKSAALQVGKALNDPVLGMTALSRSGIQFTAQQKALVQQLVTTNRTAEAQAIILAELETQFGNSARAARDTLGGALAALQNAIGDLFEMDRDDAGPIIGALESITDGVTDLGLTWKVTFAEMEVAALKLTEVLDRRANNAVRGFLGGALVQMTGGALGGGMVARAGQESAELDNLVAALDTYILDLQKQLAGRAGGRSAGAAGAGGATGGLDAFDSDSLIAKQVAQWKAALVEIGTVTDDHLVKQVERWKAGLEAQKALEENLRDKSIVQYKVALGEVKEGTDALSESSRVFVEQAQLAIARFGSDFLKDGYASLDRFWAQFLQLGRDAVGQVFAKSVMDRLGSNVGDRLAGALGSLGGAGAGILGILGLGVGAGLDRIFGQSKWERAAEAHREAARALQESAGELKAATRQSRESWLDDFLNYANDESPMERELRGLGQRRRSLAVDAFDIAKQAGGNLTNYTASILNNGDFSLFAAEQVRRDALSVNQTDLGRQALLDFADALEDLENAFQRNVHAAIEATRAQEAETRATRANSLERFRDSLGLSGLSVLSPSQQFAEAQRQYDAILALAQGGDASAIDSLPDTARTLLEAGRQMFASSTRYADIFERVNADVSTLIAAERDAASELAPVIAPIIEGFQTFTGEIMNLPATITEAAEPYQGELLTLQQSLLAEQQAQITVLQDGFGQVVQRLGAVRDELSLMHNTLRTGVTVSGGLYYPPSGGYQY
jgi:hypothetical protein